MYNTCDVRKYSNDHDRQNFYISYALRSTFWKRSYETIVMIVIDKVWKQSENAEYGNPHLDNHRVNVKDNLAECFDCLSMQFCFIFNQCYHNIYFNPLSVNDASRPPKFPVQNSSLTRISNWGHFPKRVAFHQLHKKKSILVFSLINACMLLL